MCTEETLHSPLGVEVGAVSVYRRNTALTTRGGGGGWKCLCAEETPHSPLGVEVEGGNVCVHKKHCTHHLGWRWRVGMSVYRRNIALTTWGGGGGWECLCTGETLHLPLGVEVEGGNICVKKKHCIHHLGWRWRVGISVYRRNTALTTWGRGEGMGMSVYRRNTALTTWGGGGGGVCVQEKHCTHH